MQTVFANTVQELQLQAQSAGWVLYTTTPSPHPLAPLDELDSYQFICDPVPHQLGHTKVARADVTDLQGKQNKGVRQHRTTPGLAYTCSLEAAGMCVQGQVLHQSS